MENVYQITNFIPVFVRTNNFSKVVIIFLDKAQKWQYHFKIGILTQRRVGKYVCQTAYIFMVIELNEGVKRSPKNDPKAYSII